MSDNELKSETTTDIKIKKEKRIFKYFNGIKEIYADPFEIDWKMQHQITMNPSYEVHEKNIFVQADDEGNVSKRDLMLHNDALHFYVPVVTNVFGLQKFNPETGEGMTADEILDIWTNYLEFKFDLKKNTE